MSKQCLVLGGNGFLGCNVTHELAKNGWHVRCLENRLIRSEEMLPGVEYIVGDAYNAETLAQVMQGMDSVYCFLSSSLPNGGEKNLDHEIRLTLQPLDLILRTMVQCGVKNFYFPSSGGAIYGDQFDAPVSEETSPMPITAYGVGKQMSENLIGFYCRTNQINACIFRIGNVYGSKRLRDKPQGVIDIFIQAALMHESIRIWGDATHSVRDYIYLEDAARAIALSSALNLAGMHVFNVGTGVGTSVQEIIQMIEATMGFPLTIERCPQKVSGVSRIVLDASKLQSAIGWKPMVSLQEGIQKTVAFKKVIIHH